MNKKFSSLKSLMLQCYLLKGVLLTSVYWSGVLQRRA